MNLPDIPFVAFVVVIVSGLLYKIFRHGGVKAAMFGARIDRTVGEVVGGGAKLIDVELRVHIMDGGPEKAVGVELVAKSFASYQMMPVTLSVPEAKKLIVLLETATREQIAPS